MRDYVQIDTAHAKNKFCLLVQYMTDGRGTASRELEAHYRSEMSDWVTRPILDHCRFGRLQMAETAASFAARFFYFSKIVCTRLKLFLK